MLKTVRLFQLVETSQLDTQSTVELRIGVNGRYTDRRICVAMLTHQTLISNTGADLPVKSFRVEQLFLLFILGHAAFMLVHAISK
jgi:hypothetical protein